MRHAIRGGHEHDQRGHPDNTDHKGYCGPTHATCLPLPSRADLPRRRPVRLFGPWTRVPMRDEAHRAGTAPEFVHTDISVRIEICIVRHTDHFVVEGVQARIIGFDPPEVLRDDMRMDPFLKVLAGELALLFPHPPSFA